MRLAPQFVEWMMGLPVGWVTDVPGVRRTTALKMLGNGVVPQQAYHALGHMLDNRRRYPSAVAAAPTGQVAPRQAAGGAPH